MQASPVSLRTYAGLLRSNRNFRLLWSAQVISEIGDWLYTVAIYSLIFELTKSAESVALAFVSQVLPQVVTAPAAGVLSDRISRRRLMMFTDWARAVVTFLMIFAQDRDALPLLYALLVIETVLWGLFEPARSALVPNICKDKNERLVANSLSATTWSFALMMGASIGGVLTAALGRNAVFLIDTASFAVSALLIRAIRIDETHVETDHPFRASELFDFKPIAEGIRYVLRDARLATTMFVKSGLGLMGTNWVLLPMMGEQVFRHELNWFAGEKAGVLGMSLLLGSRGLGSLICPLIAVHWTRGQEDRFRIGILVSFAVASAGYFLLGFAPSLLFACMAVMIAHGGGAMGWVFSSTLLQIHTDDKFRGRVFSAEFAFLMFTLSLTSYSAGLLLDGHMSARNVAHLTAAAVLVPGLAWAWAQRFWRHTPE